MAPPMIPKTFRLDAALVARLGDRAAARGLDPSALVREMLAHCVERGSGPAPISLPGWLAARTGLGRAEAARAVESGRVTVGDRDGPWTCPDLPVQVSWEGVALDGEPVGGD